MSDTDPPPLGETGDRPTADTAGAAAPRSPDADVRVLAPAQGTVAATVLARGFDREAGKLTLLPDPSTRRIVLRMSASNQLHAALRYGTVHAALVGDELAAIAVWCPPGVRKVTVTGAMRAVLDLLTNLPSLVPAVPHVASVLTSDVSGMIALVRKRHRAVVRASRGRAWNLQLLATVPEHRGKGLARLLLDRQLRRCDEDGAAAWLEATDPVNPPIYERFGFETVAHLDDVAWIPGLWVMRREPHRA